LAGTDEERKQDFQSFIDDPSIQAIICARGGYGSSRFIDELDFSPLLKSPKWIVGFSDITSFHVTLAKLNIASIHGIMPALFTQPNAEISLESLKDVLFNGSTQIEFAYQQANKCGEAAGVLVGGNLSLLVESLETTSSVSFDGKILVIEEISEYLYRIDRLLNQLRRAKKLDKLAGLVVGYFTDSLDTQLPFGESVEEMVLHHTQHTSYPIAFGFPSGHEQPNYAWISGASARLSVSNVGSTLHLSSQITSEKFA
jgi:muramoyltetrapeptide carboxypeptidase